MTPSERLMRWKLKRAGSDKVAFDLFFDYCQDRIHRKNTTLLEDYFQSRMREPWRTIAYAHQIWGSIGNEGIYQYLEDDAAQPFDSVLESTLGMLGLKGFEVIADYRRRVMEDPGFWKWEWHDHVFVYWPNTEPNLPQSDQADEVWRQYRDLFGRFWDATRDFELRAGALLRAE